MRTTSLTSSQQIIRRALVAACVIFALGAAGTVVGREASGVETQPAVVVTAAAPVVEAQVQLAAARIAPEVTESELLRELPVAPKTRTIEMEVTAYCACKKCCGPKAQGITASGKRVSHNDGLFVAADKSLKFGTKLIVPGYGGNKAVEVLDRGGAIKGNKLDVFFASHDEARKWGRQKLTVTVLE